MKPIDYYQIMFIYLKLSGQVEWPWHIVLMPTIIMLLLAFFTKMILEMFPESVLSDWLRDAGVK